MTVLVNPASPLRRLSQRSSGLGCRLVLW